LAALFLETADQLVEMYVERNCFTEVIDLCQRILVQDNCWERAYRHLMLAYGYLGDRGQIGRTYQRCVQTLRKELDVSPAPETAILYKKLVGN
jgi:DNA-binding SARP family transcriptional activator